MASALQEFTLDQVAAHNKHGDLYVVVDGFVYDLSKFAEFHPGGRQVLLRNAGQEVSQRYAPLSCTSA
jgi:cytochrome b involved in lipid metabolism